MGWALAAGLAAAAAAANGIGSVLQEESARRAPQDEALEPRLLARLARRPRWLAGTGLVVLTFLLHGTALAFGPLALVQPIVLLRLPFAVPLASRRRGDRLRGQGWTGLLLATGGLALFVPVAAPTGGDPLPGPGTWAVVGGAAAGAVALATLLARGRPSTRRAVLLGAAAGLVFALQAVLMRSTAALGRRGIGELLGSWQPYALGAVAIAGFLYQQSAYQAGSFAASRPPLDVAQLLASIAVGVLGMGERVRAAPWALGLEAAAIAAAVLGIALLARSPAVAREIRAQARHPGGAAPPDGGAGGRLQPSRTP